MLFLLYIVSLLFICAPKYSYCASASNSDKSSGKATIPPLFIAAISPYFSTTFRQPACIEYEPFDTLEEDVTDAIIQARVAAEFRTLKTIAAYYANEVENPANIKATLHAIRDEIKEPETLHRYIESAKIILEKRKSTQKAPAF